jgi:hypothetical protein
MLHDAHGVALRIDTSERERRLLLIRLHHVRAELRSDDPGQTCSGAELQDAKAARCVRPSGYLVRERDRSRPECDAVRQPRLALAQQDLLVQERENGARVQDPVRVATDRRAILVQRHVTSGGVKYGRRVTG